MLFRSVVENKNTTYQMNPRAMVSAVIGCMSKASLVPLSRRRKRGCAGTPHLTAQSAGVILLPTWHLQNLASRRWCQLRGVAPCQPGARLVYARAAPLTGSSKCFFAEPRPITGLASRSELRRSQGSTAPPRRADPARPVETKRPQDRLQSSILRRVSNLLVR